MNTHNFFSAKSFSFLRYHPLNNVAPPPFFTPYVASVSFWQFQRATSQNQDKIYPWSFIFMMTGTQIIKIYCYNWYSKFIFCVMGPQKAQILLMWGTFCNFWTSLVPTWNVSLLLYDTWVMSRYIWVPPSKERPITDSLGVWQGWKYGSRVENAQNTPSFYWIFGDVAHYSRTWQFFIWKQYIWARSVRKFRLVFWILHGKINVCVKQVFSLCCSTR